MIKEINDELTDLQMKCLSENIKWIIPTDTNGGGSCFRGSKLNLWLYPNNNGIVWSLIRAIDNKIDLLTCDSTEMYNISLFDAYKRFISENFE